MKNKLLKIVFLLAFFWLFSFVYPTKTLAACPYGNIACGKGTTSNGSVWIYWPQKAVDGDYSTFFQSSLGSNGYIQIDLGAAYRINRVRLLSGGLNWWGSTTTICLSDTSAFWTNNNCAYPNSSGWGDWVWGENVFSSSIPARRWVTVRSDNFQGRWREIEVYPFPPTCAISGPDSANTCSSVSYSATTYAGAGDYVTGTGIYATRQGTGDWPYQQYCNGSSCTSSITFSSTGNWNVVCNGYDSLYRCTGSPSVDYPNWADCGGSSRKVVSVSGPPAAQSCPTYCGYAGGSVPNGSCGSTSCAAVPPPAYQACPTYCGYTGGYLPNGTCGGTHYCSPVNPTPAQSCPTTCHTDYQYVPNGSCGGYTTCPPNQPAAVACSSCHTNNYYTYDGTSCSQTRYCAANAPAYQACPAYCGYTGGYLSDGNCGTHYCSAVTPPAAQSCPTTCHTNTQYVNNGSCGYTTCGPNAPAAQSCPTSCHTDTQYVPNGSCGQTTCAPNAPAGQSCPTTCHTDTQYISNGACGQTTCPSNAPPAGTCSACHTNTYTVPNGSCGNITCNPNAPAAQTCPSYCGYTGGSVPNGACGLTTCAAVTPPAAQSCPTTCHTNTQYVNNGACGYTTCAPNAPAAQTCPVTCGYAGGTVPNGSCGTITCPAITPPAAQSCPATCHTDTQYVPNGSCGQTTCPSNAPPAGTCAACHTSTYTVPDGNCGSITCLPNAPAAGTCPETCHTDTVYVPDGSCGTIPCPPTSTASCYFSLSNSQSSAGVVSKGRAGGNVSFAGNIADKMSAPQWQVNDESEVLSQPVYDYAYFDAKISSPVVLTGTPNASDLNGLNGFYKVSSDLTINNNFNISSSKKIIILVPGNLRINNQISVDEGGFLAFIVVGDIVFDKTLGVNPNANLSSTKLVDGVYIANGFIRTIPVGETPDTNKKFIGKGMFIADANLDGTGGFDLRRSLGAANPFYPAEYFEYRPDFLVNFPSQLGVRRISWKEVAP